MYRNKCLHYTQNLNLIVACLWWPFFSSSSTHKLLLHHSHYILLSAWLDTRVTTNKCYFCGTVEKKKLYPSTPPLTRYKEATFPIVKRKVVESSVTDHEIYNQLDELTSPKLCIRLNTYRVSASVIIIHLQLISTAISTLLLVIKLFKFAGSENITQDVVSSSLISMVVPYSIYQKGTQF